MTIHFTLWWLVAICIVAYIAGAIAARGFIAVLYMDGEPPWYVKLIPPLWPAAAPVLLLGLGWAFLTSFWEY